jgi:hypothetical protein
MLVYNNNQNSSSIINDLQDYMFTSKNLIRFTKHIIKLSDNKHNEYKNSKYKEIKQTNNNKHSSTKNNEINNKYIPKQKDSLFWCFYILKYGYSNYEMEINNQYFVIEKQEKFKYIDTIRRNKDILKLHKIKPYTEIEDDLANKDKISVKTFFALCILEKINVLLVDKRKIYEYICIDIDEKHPLHIIHRNSQTYEHYIELNATTEILDKYRETFLKITSFETGLKSIGSYKVDDLLDLCKKLDINIENGNNNSNCKKKKTKKDIYEMLVMNY